MTTFLIILAVIFLLWLLALRGRNGHPGWEKLLGWSYAHRGLHDGEKPENSMAAFRAALEKGYGIELDIHLLKDGNLAVMHDSSLKRTAGFDIPIEDLTTEDLAKFRLKGSDEPIPLFQQVLDLFGGKAPLIVELKAVGTNHAALCKAACDMLDKYDGPYCMESFDPRCLMWLKKNRPDILRGQLSENYLKGGKSPLPKVLQWILGNNLMNFLTRPDFIAYHFQTRKTFSNWLCRKVWRMRSVSWTLISQEEYDTAILEGWIPIFEGFKP